MDVFARIVFRFLQAKTIPLPASFPKTEIGLMTAEEFLRFRNPEEKFHGSDAYDFDLFKLNQDYPQPVGSAGSHGDDLMTVERLSGGYRVLNQGEVVAVIHNGIAYYAKPHVKNRIPLQVRSYQGKETDLGITSFKQVKYLAEVIPLVSLVAKKNEEHFPVIFQHIIVKGEPMTVRAEKHPTKDSGATLAVLNAEGLVVAQASNEWGATLLTVAQEYRGKGLGKIIGQFWYDLNPSFQSGGFTEAGRKNALALWRDRVHEFSARGWYTALIREGRLTYKRVKEILAGVGQRPETVRPVPQIPEAVKPTGDILVYSDGDISFVIYDRAFLEEPDEKFIHGFGFFRDDPHVGTFLFAIDYDRPFARMTTQVALQMAKDNGEKLYDGEGYHDLIEVEGIPGIVREGDYIEVTKDLIPVKAMAQKEKRLRKAVDPYDEKYHLLLEMAESKWG
jgi:GNAT superfamily N-acetyltransferase